MKQIYFDNALHVALWLHKRFVSLTSDERITLEAGRHHHRQHQFRARCQALLLSADGLDVARLQTVPGMSRVTVYAWFERWETGGLAGRANATGQGRKPTLTLADEAPVRAAVEANRPQLKDVTATLRQELDKSFSPTTLRRFLKSLVGASAASATA